MFSKHEFHESRDSVTGMNEIWHVVQERNPVIRDMSGSLKANCTNVFKAEFDLANVFISAGQKSSEDLDLHDSNSIL